MPDSDIARAAAPARPRRTPATLYRALTLEERAGALGRGARSAGGDEGSLRRLRTWKQQHPFGSGPLFERRLAAAGVDESQLLALLGERPARLRKRHANPPGWLLDLAAVCAGDAVDTLPPLPDTVKGRPEHRFLRAAGPQLQDAHSRLIAGVARIATGDAGDALRSPALAGLLGEEMFHAALNELSRTMVLELHVARLDGRLSGDSAEQRFHSFVDLFLDHAPRAALFQEYPVLGRLVRRTLDRYVDTRLEFLERLSTDRERLSVVLGGPDADDEIVGVRTIGDPHRGGRGVLLVRFRSGLHVVYKPKPLAVDRHFQELLHWLNERGWDAPFRLCRFVDRGEYGWMEFLAQAPCGSHSEVAGFYRRLGGYLALLHGLGATDLHFENLVAVGDQPMLIDLETLFHPVLLGSSPDVGTARVNREIAESVLSVGLLPERTTLGPAGSEVDLSGLGARVDQVSPEATPCWVASGTDAMRLDRQQMVLPAGEHAPALHEADNRVDFSAYADDVIAGFEGLYRMLRDHRAALLAPDGPLAVFRDDCTRVVLRPTHSYYVLSREGGHPDLLRDALDRDRHFDRLWAGVASHPELERVVNHERADLWWGDIPLFTTRPCSRDIWTSRGERIPDYLAESGMQLVERRLGRLGEPDLERQLWLVRAALATAMPAGAPAVAAKMRHLLAPRPLIGQSPLDLAAAIGDRLVATALRDKGYASWVGEMAAGHRGSAVRPLGTDLYSGLSGVTLFLASLGTVSGEARYLASAREALRSLRAQVASRAGAAGIGGFSGWGSAVYTLSHLAVLFDEPDLSHEAEALAVRLSASIDSDNQFDVVAGVAGFLLALVSLHRVRRSSRVLDLARRCGDRLLETAQPAGPGVGWRVPGSGGLPLAGLSHGAAGIALSLLELGALTGERAYHEAAAAAIRYERSLFDASAGSWRDLRPDPGAAPAFLDAWCHGAPGIGLARLSGLGRLDDAQVRSEIETAVETTLRKGFETNHSLCHGALGNLELPLAAARVLDRADWQADVDAAAGAIVRGLTRRGPVCGSLCGIETPGFMTGLSGIGYGLLRLAQPDRVASVLMMEPPLAPRRAVAP